MRKIVLNHVGRGIGGQLRAALSYLATGAAIAGSTLVSDTASGAWPMAVDYAEMDSALDVRIKQCRLLMANGEALVFSEGVTADWGSLFAVLKLAPGGVYAVDPRYPTNYPAGLSIPAGNAAIYSGGGNFTVYASDRGFAIHFGNARFTFLVMRPTASGSASLASTFNYTGTTNASSGWKTYECPPGSATLSNTTPHFFPSFSSTGYGRDGMLIHPAALLHVLSGGSWSDMGKSVVHSFVTGSPEDTLVYDGVTYTYVGDGMWLK